MSGSEQLEFRLRAASLRQVLPSARDAADGGRRENVMNLATGTALGSKMRGVIWDAALVYPPGHTGVRADQYAG